MFSLAGFINLFRLIFLMVCVQIDNFIDHLKLRGFSRRTIDSYMFHVNHFLRWCNKDIDLVVRDDIRNYLIKLVNKEYSANTIRLCYAALKHFFVYTVKLQINFDGIELPKKEKKLPRFLTKKEVLAMISLTKNLKHRLLIEMIYCSGMRVSECIKLKRTSINTDNNTILVVQGKGRKERMTLLSEKAKKELVKYLCLREKSSDYLFEGRKGHISVKTAQAVVQQAADRAGLGKRVTPHMLRHSFATHLLEQGVSIRLIPKLLGHSRLKTTEIYTHAASTQLINIKNPLDF